MLQTCVRKVTTALSEAMVWGLSPQSKLCALKVLTARQVLLCPLYVLLVRLTLTTTEQMLRSALRVQ